jgi:excisionase family DNA binding protein
MYTTAEAAQRAGVSKNTLLRWIAEGRLADVARDWRNWRVWSEADVARVCALRDQLHGGDSSTPTGSAPGGGPSEPALPMPVPEYAADLDQFGAGRAFRRELPDRQQRKNRALAQYASELSNLAQGRSYRSGGERVHDH